jgi:thiol-disulfide isomerase/thioredoxin
MKKILLFALATFALVACDQQPQGGYLIKGKIAGNSEEIKAGQVILKNRDKSNPISDTTEIIKGKFSFKGVVETPEHYSIVIKGLKGGITLFLENGKYTINGVDSTFISSKIDGPSNHELFDLLDEKREALEKSIDAEMLIGQYSNPTTSKERKKEIISRFDKMDEIFKAFEDSVVKANEMTYFGLFKFIANIDEIPFDQAETKLNAFLGNEKFKDNKNLQKAVSTLEILRQIQPGMKAQDIKMKSPDGKDILLSDIYSKNKITMIDFWAGWCSPCREFNPELLKIYTDYHKKGFEVYAISLDKERDSWLNAIDTDKLPWIHVSDVNYWTCDATKIYHVRSIPSNVFVDQNGIIVARKWPKDKIVALLDQYTK